MDTKKKFDVHELLCDNGCMTSEEYINQQGNWFCTVSNIFEQREALKKAVKEFPFYAYIDHMPDKITEESDKGEHTHFLFRTNGSRKIKTVASLLDIPPNFIQICRKHRSYGRYLMHLDDPEKIQYEAVNVITNSPSTVKCWVINNADDDINRLYADLDKLRRGEISRGQFVELHYLEFQKMQFYQKIKTFEYIQKIAHKRY